jgi:hypothetical protein
MLQDVITGWYKAAQPDCNSLIIRDGTIRASASLVPPVSRWHNSPPVMSHTVYTNTVLGNSMLKGGNACCLWHHAYTVLPSIRICTENAVKTIWRPVANNGTCHPTYTTVVALKTRRYLVGCYTMQSGKTDRGFWGAYCLKMEAVGTYEKSISFYQIKWSNIPEAKSPS